MSGRAAVAFRLVEGQRRCHRTFAQSSHSSTGGSALLLVHSGMPTPIRSVLRCLSPLAASFWAAAAPAQPGTIEQTPVGQVGASAFRVPTAQVVRPAGDVIEIQRSRPIDLVATADGRFAVAKDNAGLVALSVAPGSALAAASRLSIEGGTSMVGLAIINAPAPDQPARIFATSAKNTLIEAALAPDGTLSLTRTIELPKATVGGEPFPCGVAITRDGQRAFVALSRSNQLAEIDLDSGAVLRTIDVGIAPYAVVLSPDQSRVFVTCWGGARPDASDTTADSAGSQAKVDARGIASSGGVCIVDLATASGETPAVRYVETGLSASAVALTSDASIAYVANANHDTVSVVDVREARVLSQIVVKPDPRLPFGSMPNGLALSADGTRLFVACGGNNAVAVIDTGRSSTSSARPAESQARILGWIPAGWCPGPVTVTNENLLIANIRGIGSRNDRADQSFNSHRHVGTLQRVALLDIADAPRLQEMTAQTLADSRVPQALAAIQRDQLRKDVKPVPIPKVAGEPSVFEHVIYIIKENRTYDQIFGALAAGENPKGRGRPDLCIYGREITPNHHALAEQFVLLDNYYCNGVLSADGHSWATEGNVTPYLERSFGGFTRSYTFGDDPLTYSSSGFIWDHVLAAGYSFRNYGEFNYTDEKPDSSFPEIWADWKSTGNTGKGGKITFEHKINTENVKRYSNLDAPGWNMDIPDQIRADVFLREFAEFEKNGTLPNFIVIYLPNDHTSGTGEGNPTPRALVADNDLALGRIVEAVSKSKFWPKTVFFINEDDPQDGWDHVDGHRSICLVVSPFTKRGEVISEFYNQSGVIHTIQRIFGVASPNQRTAQSNLMSACFNQTPDFTPFKFLPSNIDLTEMNPKKSALGPAELHWALVSEAQDLIRVDAANEDQFNRVLWHAAKGANTPYPEAYAGAHGKGLASRGLSLDPQSKDDDEHEEGHKADDEDR